VIADLAARRGIVPPAPEDETPRGLFRRALELERAALRGEVLTADQARWLAGYQTHPDYAAERLLWDGDDAIFG
jgi:putative transposase